MNIRRVLLILLISLLVFLVLIISLPVLMFGWERWRALEYYDIPEYAVEEDSNWHDDIEPEGYERRQFAVCKFRRWCTYDYIQVNHFVIFRDNNKYTDKQFGTVKEVKETTYIIEVANVDGQKILREIPKSWVFGKD